MPRAGIQNRPELLVEAQAEVEDTIHTDPVLTARWNYHKTSKMIYNGGFRICHWYMQTYTLNSQMKSFILMLVMKAGVVSIISMF